MSCKQAPKAEKERCIIEFVGDSFNPGRVQELAKSFGADNTQLYRWKNHFVFYSQFSNKQAFTQEMAKQFPELSVKVYEKPFYDFSRAQHCGQAQLAPNWEHIILTANLVEDKELQNEYMEYHRTQFEQWPEVANGFCNADFQQLQVFRNGRQLMLVISIPANKTLDELNPKTVENNPRMNEWNEIMGQYQEGIEGTSPDEKWVFLTKSE
ncbi:L-rhamnose mutarotase [uncultured Draconibacterium sp.]|uniref:L-rhamnose mutarotase n=1 Tax=uncultured Draconibacterium sp. TaxID=1573823 RepID=UPI0025D5EAF5|nr:L-rhamnose mutarotase [uncultured Draconibacterium sp.]